MVPINGTYDGHPGGRSLPASSQVGSTESRANPTRFKQMKHKRRKLMGHVMIHNTRGKDHIERASLAFLVGNTALSSGQEATLLLTIEGVWVATKGYTEGLQAQ